MQFISIDKVNSGDILGKTLYGGNGMVLLNSGTILQEAYINSIIKHGFSGIYVETEFSKEIMIEDIISEDLRREAVDSVRNVFTKFQYGPVGVTVDDLGNVRTMMDNIVSQILDSRGSIINLVDLKAYDNYTFQHSVSVAVISISIGVAMGLPRAKLFNLGMAAIFHDIGKVKVPLDVLNKPSKLTDEEFAEIMKHPTYGYGIAKRKFDLPTEVFVAILEHHEKFNGQGYPNKLAGDKILLNARIIAVADVYDAVTSQRPYNKPMTPSEGYELIMANAYSHFDPDVVNAFVTKIAAYPLGTTVTLSNDMKAVVIENHEDCMMRPKVKVIHSGSEKIYIDLKNDIDARSLTIIAVVA